MRFMRAKNLFSRAVHSLAGMAGLATSAFAQDAPATVKPTAPFLVDADQISSGDTAWMLVSCALVLMMTLPGLALFYGGMVRKKNLLSTMAQSFAIACLVTVLWVVIGYSPGVHRGLAVDRRHHAFRARRHVLRQGRTGVGFAPRDDDPRIRVHDVPAHVRDHHAGAHHRRVRGTHQVLVDAVFMGLWSLCVYAPMAHWVWSPDGWLASLGVLDFAGGTVVHINAGVTGLACVIMLGERKGYGTDPIFPHNLALTITGAALLWVGWFGFNAGSALSAGGLAGLAFANTHCAAATAALTWMAIEWAARGKASVLGIASGAIAGLVAVTPAAGYVGIGAALVIGVAASLACFGAVVGLKSWFGYDDSLDAFGIHAVGGIVGALLTGVFASTAIGGVEGSITAQLIGIGACAAYSLVVSLVLLMLISVTIGLRVSEEAEAAGLDVSTHGESVE